MGMAKPNVHEQPASTPNSPEHEEEDIRADEHSSTEATEEESVEGEQRQASDLGNPEDEGMTSSDSEDDSDSNSSDNSDSTGEGHLGENGEDVDLGDRSSGNDGDDPDEGAPRQNVDQDAESTTGGYSFSGVGDVELVVSPKINVPRVYSWISAGVTSKKSVFRAGCDLADIVALLIG